MATEPAVYIVDDDDAVRDSLQALLESAGCPVKGFASGRAFLDTLTGAQTGCVLLDLHLPDLSGLEIQESLNRCEQTLPVIVITGYGDVSTAVRAMKAGAFDFIEKPFSDGDLLERVREALRFHEKVSDELEARAEIVARIDRLTPRERDVFDHLVLGQANKVIAYELGISPRTVEIHRARVMEKLEARSLSEIVRMAITAGPGTTRAGRE